MVSALSPELMSNIEAAMISRTKETLIAAERKLISANEQVKAAVRATQIAIYEADQAGLDTTAISEVVGLSEPEVVSIVEIEHDLRESQNADAPEHIGG